MKRYLRTCFYYNNIDAAFAFLSLIAIAIGCHELALRSQGLTSEHLRHLSKFWLWFFIACLVASNYAILLLTNPRRWIVCALFLPVRLLFIGVILLIKSMPVIFALISMAKHTSAMDNRAKSKNKRHTKAERQSFAANARTDIKAAAGHKGAAAASVYFVSRASSALESRLRSKNDQHVIVEVPHKPLISTEQP